MSKKLFSWGFENSKSNSSLFILRCRSSIILLLVYVDDVVVTGNDTKLIDELVRSLDKQFSLKDWGILTYFFGFQIHYFDSGFVLNQEKYVDDLLQKLQFQDLKPTHSPSVAGKHLSLSEGTSLADPFLYRSTIRALQYLTHTRPDISYIVNNLSQFLQRPINAHWQAVKRVL